MASKIGKSRGLFKLRAVVRGSETQVWFASLLFSAHPLIKLFTHIGQPFHSHYHIDVCRSSTLGTLPAAPTAPAGHILSQKTYGEHHDTGPMSPHSALMMG